MGFEAKGACRHVQEAEVVTTIGIDTGKKTLHLIGLDHQRTIFLRKVARGRIGTRLANMPHA
jgi:transposase